MLQKILRRFIKPRHYWRDLGFDELSELYTSMMFRSLAISLTGIFIPIYLYHLGHSIWQILFFYAAMFATHALAIYPTAQLIAKVGPKHTILTSYMFQVTSLVMLVMLENVSLPLVLIAMTYGIGSCLFFLAFHVDFSKVKHSEHGGKEVGWMYSMERLGAVLGPVLGGLVGYFIGAEYIFLTAVILLFAGIIPLFSTREPTKLNQKLDFRGLKVSEIKSDLLAWGSFGAEAAVSVIVWPLFIGLYVFAEDPYIQLGIITSISVLVSLFIARAIGKTIDKKRGRLLLSLGTVLNAVIHVFRPFTGGFTGALGVNLANEVATPMYKMPLIKGLYDAADDLPGKRIVYLAAAEVTSATTRAVFFTTAGLAAYFVVDSRSVFTALFIVGAIASLFIMFERFRALES